MTEDGRPCDDYTVEIQYNADMSRAFKFAKQVVNSHLAFGGNISDVVVDLGSYQTRVMSVNEVEPLIIPSCMVQSREGGKVISIGQEAKEIVGRSAHDLEVVLPVKEGNFTDYRLAKLFLEHCFEKINPSTEDAVNIPGKVFFFVSPQMNEVQHRSLLKICKEVGVPKVSLLVRPLVAALAKQVTPDLQSASSLQLLIDCGYESTTFSILQFGKVFHFHQVWYGGKDLTQDIMHFLKMKYHIEIGAQSAERLKHECAKVLKGQETIDKKEHLVVIRGRDVLSSLPKSIKVESKEFRPLFQQYVQTVLEQLTFVTEELGPELIEELIHKGFLVFGGMAVVELLIYEIEKQYGTLVYRPEFPDLLCHQGFKEYLRLPAKTQKQFFFSL